MKFYYVVVIGYDPDGAYEPEQTISIEKRYATREDAEHYVRERNLHLVDGTAFVCEFEL